MAYYLVIDLGGSFFRVGIGTDNPIIPLERRLVNWMKENTTKRPDRLWIPGQIIDLVHLVLNRESLSKEDITAIGIATPGPIQDGVIIGSPNLGCDYIPIVGPLMEEFNVPILHDNDANTAANGMGLARPDIRDQVTMCISTGIGGGVYQDGGVRRGANYSSGEIGHFQVGWGIRGQEASCGCGALNCWEAHSSGSGIAGKAASFLMEYPSKRSYILSYVSSSPVSVAERSPLSLQELFDGESESLFVPSGDNLIQGWMVYHAYHDGDPLAKRLVGEAIEVNKRGFGTINNAYNPQAIFVYGGVALGQWPITVAPVIEEFGRPGGYCRKYTINPVPKIEKVPFDQIVLLGALANAIEAANRL
ncbi:ROK family protein [Candidatus Woesearchaeota archaeon]|nr:ROK family protein [Candidatus Woesearchaeota archaeon]